LKWARPTRPAPDPSQDKPTKSWRPWLKWAMVVSARRRQGQLDVVERALRPASCRAERPARALLAAREQSSARFRCHYAALRPRRYAGQAGAQATRA
jgi:hypothetical protein